MRDALPKHQLRTIYDRVAGHYDIQHAFFTARSDQRGRVLLVDRAVRAGDRVLDCGAGTGATGLLAAQKVGIDGRVTLFDMSAGMLAVAERKARQANLQQRVGIETGDMLALPFADGSFDTVLSTYSLCPVYDPDKGARELYRVTRPGGLIGVAHSTEPFVPWVKWLAQRVEQVVWRLPSISLGCRAVAILPIFEELGCEIVFRKDIGVPLWPFIVFVVRKPA